MFTLEINGRAIAVIYADEENARELLDDEDFQADLRGIESGGKAIWNGADALNLRPATPEEAEAADATDDSDGLDGDDDLDDDDDDLDDGDEDDLDDDDEGEMVVVFLVPMDEDA